MAGLGWLPILSLAALLGLCSCEAILWPSASDIHTGQENNVSLAVEGGPVRFPHGLQHGPYQGYWNSELFKKDQREWPAFVITWKLMVSTVIILLGSAAATAAGVGGGGIFIPMFTLLLGFDSKTAAALSKSLVFVGSTTAACNNVRQRHPRVNNRSLIDYEMASLLQPTLMLGISIGVICNATFPDWVLTVLLILVVSSMAVKCFKTGLASWRKETEISEKEAASISTSITKLAGLEICNEVEDHLKGVETKSLHKPLIPKVITQPPIMWTEVGLMVLVWVIFSLIQIVKEVEVTKCGALYWILNASQIPIALSASATGAWRIYKKQRTNNRLTADEISQGQDVSWTTKRLIVYPLITCFAGTIGGFLGLGGGMILGPMFLELGVCPQVTSATSTFMIMFSSSMSVLEYYLLGRLPVNFAAFFGVGILVAASIGLQIMRHLVSITGRASIITFTLGSIVGLSAIFLGAIGSVRNIAAYLDGQYMGFDSLCNK